MKIIFRSQIPEFRALPAKQKRKITRSANQTIPKIYSVVAVFLGVLTCAAMGFADKQLKMTTGSDELWWTVDVAAISLVVIFGFFWNTMILNPRIKKLVEK